LTAHIRTITDVRGNELSSALLKFRPISPHYYLTYQSIGRTSIGVQDDALVGVGGDGVLPAAPHEAAFADLVLVGEFPLGSRSKAATAAAD
jgi:hypothetical protein